MNAARPLLSVVVPFYGVEDDIEECLESLRNQTLADLEVVLVDDGSPDHSRDVAERFVAADPRFRLVTQPNQGLGPARNTGVRHARGRYLAFVDSDDVVVPDAYERLVGSLEQTGSDIAAGDVLRLDRDGLRQSWVHRQLFSATRTATDLARTPGLAVDRMVWNKVYRRAFWDAGGYAFPAIRYEDYPVTLRAYLDAEGVDVLAGHVYQWRDRDSGQSITQQSHRLDNARDRHRSALLVLETLDRPGTPDQVRRLVHANLVHVDLVALAGAAVRVPAADRPEAEQLAVDLARRLDPVGAGEASRPSRLIRQGLVTGDVRLARALARRRSGGGRLRLVADLAASPRSALAVLRSLLADRSG